MGRNRKNGSAVRFVPAMKAALICALLGVSAIGYVYQKNQIFELGKQIQAREKRLAELRDSNAKFQKALLTMRSAPQLEKRMRELNLGLVQPAQSQILTITEVPVSSAPKSQPVLAEQEPGTRRAQIFAAAR
jgi:cell division protein FtsB